MVRFEVVVWSWDAPLLQWPRPSRPSWRRKTAGGPALHPERERRAEAPAEGRRGPTILFRDGKAADPGSPRGLASVGWSCRRRKIVGPPRLPGRAVCRPVRPLRRPGRGSVRRGGASAAGATATTAAVPAVHSRSTAHAASVHEAGDILRVRSAPELLPEARRPRACGDPR